MATLEKPEEVDRENTCPFLIRLFFKLGDNNPIDAYRVRGREPEHELKVYTWMDADLREIADITRTAVRQLDTRRAALRFRLVFPNSKGENKMKEIGTVSSNPDDPSPDDSKTLR